MKDQGTSKRTSCKIGHSWRTLRRHPFTSPNVISPQNLLRCFSPPVPENPRGSRVNGSKMPIFFQTKIPLMVQKSGEHQLRLVVYPIIQFTMGFLHPRWWSPDFWTINGTWPMWRLFDGWEKMRKTYFPHTTNGDEFMVFFSIWGSGSKNPSWKEWPQSPTVDRGNPANQLIISLSVYPIIYRVLIHPRWLAGFLNHQQ